MRVKRKLTNATSNAERGRSSRLNCNGRGATRRGRILHSIKRRHNIGKSLMTVWAYMSHLFEHGEADSVQARKAKNFFLVAAVDRSLVVPRRFCGNFLLLCSSFRTSSSKLLYVFDSHLPSRPLFALSVTMKVLNYKLYSRDYRQSMLQEGYCMANMGH